MFVSQTFLQNVPGWSSVLENAQKSRFPEKKTWSRLAPCADHHALATIDSVSAILRICFCLWDFAVGFLARVTVWHSHALRHLDSWDSRNSDFFWLIEFDRGPSCRALPVELEIIFEFVAGGGWIWVAPPCCTCNRGSISTPFILNSKMILNSSWTLWLRPFHSNSALPDMKIYVSNRICTESVLIFLESSLHS